MKNYFSRYFRKNDTYIEDKVDIADCQSFSDSVYDQSKGITHFLHRYNSKQPSATRFVGDVEICMSNDPSITSLFTAEHRSILKKQLTNQPRGKVSGQPTDDQLLKNGPINSLERDEIVKSAKLNAKAFDADAKEALRDYYNNLSRSDISSVQDNTSNTE